MYNLPSYVLLKLNVIIFIMSWQVAIILHVLVSALMSLLVRHYTLINKRAYFSIVAIMYITIFVFGLFVNFVFADGYIMIPRNTKTWLCLLLEGALIPAAWLLQYKIISHLGVTNANISSSLKYVTTALLGTVFLGEKLSLTFLVGMVLIIIGIYIVTSISPDEYHELKLTRFKTVFLIISMSILYSLGMLIEKLAIDATGVWSYSVLGWFMQALFASLYMIIFGRHELSNLKKKTFRQGVFLGFTVALAGVFFVYALSMGTLSQSVMVAGSKLLLTTVLAAIFYKERNDILKRMIALLLSIIGLLLILSS